MIFIIMIIEVEMFIIFIHTQLFRDPSAWYHIVFAYDSTQATSSNRHEIIC
jgi:hypothetical protein